MVGQQTKFSEMVKGKQHDQTFDETLEFVLAAGKHTMHWWAVSVGIHGQQD